MTRTVAPALPRVLVLTDRAQLPAGRTLQENLARLSGAGATLVVVRELDLPDRAGLVASVTGQVAVISARRWVPGAIGVHLAAAQPDGHPAWAPQTGRLRGRSCHSTAEITRAVGGGASYVTISPVAASESKPGYGPVLGADGVRRAVAVAGVTPVYALGGVSPENAADLRAAGAYGVAVMGALMRAPDPAKVYRRLVEAVS